jgi:hypothetical protein
MVVTTFRVHTTKDRQSLSTLPRCSLEHEQNHAASCDKAVWKAFRRELIKEGVPSRLLEKHKKTIKRYVMELSERGGVLDELVQEEMEMKMEMENYDISTIQHSNPDLGEGPNTEVTQSMEAPSISPTEAEDVLHLDDLDQATMEISVDTNFISNSESFAGEPSSTNSSSIVLSDVANIGKTSEPEALHGSSPSLPSDGRVHSTGSRRKKVAGVMVERNPGRKIIQMLLHPQMQRRLLIGTQ